MAERAGYFYILQIVPELAPGRIKLGWSANPRQRLSHYRCLAPTAQMLRLWPCLFDREQSMMILARQLGCVHVSGEVFDAIDIYTVVQGVSAYLGDTGIAVPQPSEFIPRQKRSLKLTRLRDIRERRLLTQQELAERVGMHQEAISAIESGKTSPTPKTIRRIAAALDVEPQDLMAPEESKLAA